MRIHLQRCRTLCVRVAAFCGLALIAGAAMAGPFTEAIATVNTGGTGGVYSDTSSVTTPGASSSASVAVGANTVGADGSHADASAAAFANFGTLGVAGSGNGLTPPATPTTGVDSGSLASAFWDDVLTPVPVAGSALSPGASVIADLLLDFRFSNSLSALTNADAFFNYEMTAFLGSTLVLDDCFVTDMDHNDLCDRGSLIIGMPGNTNGPLTMQLDAVALQLSMLQPFELSVGLSVFGNCGSGPDLTQFSSCSFDGDAFHTSNAFLQPTSDFVLVAASGHDYSRLTTSNVVSEPGSVALALLGLGLAGGAIARRRHGVVASSA